MRITSTTETPATRRYDGYFYLIYNNGSEDDPLIVISDYTVEELAEKIYKEVERKYAC